MNESMPGTAEEKLSGVIAKFHRDQHGHLPTCSSTILPNMAVVLSSNVFTLTETELSQTQEGRKIIQSARREQRALTRRDAESSVAKVLGRRVSKSFYDLDVRSGEQIEVYILD